MSRGGFLRNDAVCAPGAVWIRVIFIRDIGRPADGSYPEQIPLQFQQVKAGQFLRVRCADFKRLASPNPYAALPVCQTVAVSPPRRGGVQVSPVQKLLLCDDYWCCWQDLLGGAQPVELDSDGMRGSGEGLEREPSLIEPEMELSAKGEVVCRRLAVGRIFVKLAPLGSLLPAPEALEKPTQIRKSLLLAGGKWENMRRFGIDRSSQDTKILIPVFGLLCLVSCIESR